MKKKTLKTLSSIIIVALICICIYLVLKLYDTNQKLENAQNTTTQTQSGVSITESTKETVQNISYKWQNCYSKDPGCSSCIPNFYKSFILNILSKETQKLKSENITETHRKMFVWPQMP